LDTLIYTIRKRRQVESYDSKQPKSYVT
jgi:hypothetical protein